MRKTNTDTRGNNLKYVAVLLVVVFLLSAALLVLELWEKDYGRFPEQDIEENTITYDGKKYVFSDDIETFLVIGLDKFEGDITADSYKNDQQADFLMLLVYDNKNKKCTPIQINRDTMTSVNILGVAGNKIDSDTMQIALAHTYGNGKEASCRNTANAVSGLMLGVYIDHYISVTMDSIITLNDLVGGVEVTINDDFSGIDDTLVKGETVTLMGEHAMNYVRTRYGLEDSSNENRMERQRRYISELYKKIVEKIEKDENFIVDASLKLADYIVSDRTVNQLQDFAKRFAEYETSDIITIDGENIVGERFMEFYADETSVKKIVTQYLCEVKD